MIPTLARFARVVAPDYFGFGRSDKPTARGWYSYDGHYASIERFADELDLRETTLVVQDWGGPIGLRLAVERPDRIARLVVLNTGIGARAPSSTRRSRAPAISCRKTGASCSVHASPSGSIPDSTLRSDRVPSRDADAAVAA